MNLSRAYIFIILFGLQSAAYAQADSTRADSISRDSTLVDSLSMNPLEVSQADTADTTGGEDELFTITPWEFHPPIGAELTATDSTLRWQIWPDWSYKLNRDPGIITYRLGSGIRSNGIQRHAHEPRYQQLYWEGISLNDPVSGRPNWSLIPQHKLSRFYDQDLGTEHRSTFYLHQYYLNKPLSRLIYSESNFSFRNLEFEVSHNISQRTNIELSYWDRRAGGEYSNSEITGRQIYGKVSHHLDHRRYLKLNFMTNSYDVGQSFGYNITDLPTFNFDRYTTGADETSALSNETANLLSLNYYQRSIDSAQGRDNLHAGLFFRGAERGLRYSADSTGYKVRSLGANAKKWWNIGGFHMEGGFSYQQFFNQSAARDSFTANDWSLLNGEGNISIGLNDLLQLQGGAEFRLRSDDFRSYRINTGSKINIGGLSINAGVSKGNIMPTPQQLYWSSDRFKGNPGLVNEDILEGKLTLSYNFSPDTEFGVRGQHKDITDGIMIADSNFVNVSSYASQSATAFFTWDLTHFELNGSATIHRFTESRTSSDNIIPMSDKERVWLKGGAYWKGYLFDRAAYVKAGVSGMMAPLRYQADHYYPELDFWQPVSRDQELPVFNRMDVDISARVRSIMIILRWENVLDDVHQLGYFETAQYPMSQRRFIFGVRALFRN